MENVETWFRIWNYVYQKQVFIKSYIIYNLCNVSQKIANLLKKKIQNHKLFRLLGTLRLYAGRLTVASKTVLLILLPLLLQSVFIRFFITFM